MLNKEPLPHQIYRNAFWAMNRGFTLLDIQFDEQGQPYDLIIRDANPAQHRIDGVEARIGIPVRDYFPSLEPKLIERFAQVAMTGEGAQFEDWSEATQRWYEVDACSVGESSPSLVAISFTDITQRKRHEESMLTLEQRKSFLLQLSDEMRPLSDAVHIQYQAARVLGEFLQANRVGYAETQDDEHLVVVTRHFTRAVEGIQGVYRYRDYGPDLLEQMLLGKTVVRADVANDPLLTQAEKQAHALLQLGATVNVPLVKQGHLVAILFVHCQRAHHFSALEIELIEETAERIWAAVERARAEEALRRSEEQFRLLVTASSNSLYRMSADWSQMLNLRGMSFLSDTQQANMHWLKRYIPHEDQLMVQQAIQQAILTKQPFELEHRVIKADGSVGWTLSRAIPVLDEQGGIREWFGAATDIDDRRRAEAALRESEKRLRLTIEATELATWEWNLATNQVYWNEQHFRLFGLEPQPNPLSADAFMRHVHPQDQARITELLAKAIAERGVYEAEFCAVLADGATRWMSDYGRITEERDGQPVLMSGVMFDVDERRRAQDTLRRSEERLQKALSIQTVGVIFFNQQTMIRDANEAFLRMSGVSQPDIDQQLTSLVDLTLPPWRPLCQQAITELTTLGRSLPHEKELLRPDGSQWWGLFAGSRLSEDEFVEFVIDVTERRGAEEALRLADRRKDEFLAMLAHELRNPMAILYNTLLALNPPAVRSDSLPIEDALPIMNREIVHLNRLVDDLLDVSRINQGKIELQSEPVALNSLVWDILLATRPEFRAHRQVFISTLSEEPLWVRGDPTRLAQIIRNLITNAGKYTPDGGQIQVSLTGQESQVVLSVKDNGIGLAADQLEAIFGVFVQVPTSLDRSQGGLGLGLAMVKQLAELHGGLVAVQSPGLGQGSEFILTLPRIDPPSAAAPVVSLTGTTTLTQTRLLVVDDNADLARMTALALRNHQYQVHTCLSGEEALATVEAWSPDAVLLDLGMPGLDGYETCQRLRQLAWGQQGLIIALSGYGGAADRQKTRSAGFDGHLLKPMQMDALDRLLTDLLQPRSQLAVQPVKAVDERQSRLVHDLRSVLSLISFAAGQLGETPSEEDRQELLAMLGRNVEQANQLLTDWSR